MIMFCFILVFYFVCSFSQLCSKPKVYKLLPIGQVQPALGSTQTHPFIEVLFMAAFMLEEQS